MPAVWFVKLGETIEGPLTGPELRDRARRGEVTPQTPVRRGESRWIRAARVQGLFPLLEGGQTEEPEDDNPFVAVGPDEPAEPEGPEASRPSQASEPNDAPNPLAALGLAPTGPPPAPATPQEPVPVPISPPKPVSPFEPAAPPAPEEPGDPFALKLDDDGPLRGGPPPIKPTSKTGSVDDVPALDLNARRAYLPAESLVRSLGALFLLNGLLLAGTTTFWAVITLGEVERITGDYEQRLFYRETWLTGATLIIAISACFLLGTGLRQLKGWARWATVTLLVQLALAGVVGLVALAIAGDGSRWPMALALVLFAMLLPGLLVGLLLPAEVETVCSAAYQRLKRTTPGLRPRFHLAVAVILLVELGALMAIAYLRLAPMGERATQPVSAASEPTPLPQAEPEPEDFP